MSAFSLSEFCFAFFLVMGRGNRNEKRNEGEEKGGGKGVKEGKEGFFFFFFSQKIEMV
jgi:hypothetical protein